MIGRKQEIKKIQLLLNSDRSEFLAVTGRRRVGKTYLIDQTLSSNFCFSLTGIQNGSTQTQLVNFGIKLAEYQESTEPRVAKNWQMAFIQLKSYLKTLDKDQKQVIFIDELPWVYTARSGFIQLLAHLWNDYLSKESHFILVICGSATSWISKKVINDRGGLHNRLTENIHLHPFTLSETQEFLSAKGLRYTHQEIARIYMSLGGIPFYLENLRKGESFAVAIERMCFSPSGLLKNEYKNLYQALFNHADLHQAIVAVLASHHYGRSHSDILDKLKMKSTGSYQRAIEELIISDFVAEHTPFKKKKRGSMYRLIDEYSIFYHQFIKSNQKYIPGMWQQLAESQAYKSWAGYAFENLCHKHIKEIKQALGIGAVYTEVSSFSIASTSTQKGVQIDLLIDRKDDSINICEIKFYSGPFSLDRDYYEKLIEKRQRFIDFTKTRKQVFITMITNHGVKQNAYSSEIIDSEIILSDLIQAEPYR